MLVKLANLRRKVMEIHQENEELLSLEKFGLMSTDEAKEILDESNRKLNEVLNEIEVLIAQVETQGFDLEPITEELGAELTKVIKFQKGSIDCLTVETLSDYTGLTENEILRLVINGKIEYKLENEVLYFYPLFVAKYLVSKN